MNDTQAAIATDAKVDAHNVVPAWIASEKLEYGARTIRGKLHDKAKDLFTDFPPVICHPNPSKSALCLLQEAVDWKAIKESLVGVVDESVEPVAWAKGGCNAGLAQLFSFLRHRLRVYARNRNDPTKRALSNLSPWLHFGYTPALQKGAKRWQTSRDIMDELIAWLKGNGRIRRLTA
ncbi:Deoxyribodipyrimidine photo-lyase [Taenia solium]|eukprot:TsM_000380300 transcript=TsM_000380300 gene=TsM_000380300